MKINLKESAPKGTFEYVKDKISQALRTAKIFKDNEYPYIMYTYMDSIIVSLGDKFFSVPYVFDIKGEIKFGDKQEVEQEFEVKDAQSNWYLHKEQKDLKENIEILEESKDMDISFGEFISLREDTYDETTGEVEAILIEAGTNPQKKRHYPKETIKEAAEGFSGLKMYINHQTAKEEKERPERDLRDWVSTIVESRYEDGKAVGRIAIHDKWLRERMKDPVVRKHIGLSINAGGKISYGKIDGEEMQIVEKIVMNRQNGPASVDWVTEAGARGRVSRLLKESAYETENNQMKTLKEASFEDLQKENPDLVKKIQESVKVDDAKLQEANNKIVELENKIKLNEQKGKIESILKESKLPEVAKTRILNSLKESIFADDAKLKEAIDLKVKEELAYINSLSGKGKINLGESVGSENVGVKETLQQQLDKRMGHNEKE